MIALGAVLRLAHRDAPPNGQWAFAAVDDAFMTETAILSVAGYAATANAVTAAAAAAMPAYAMVGERLSAASPDANIAAAAAGVVELDGADKRDTARAWGH